MYESNQQIEAIISQSSTGGYEDILLLDAWAALQVIDAFIDLEKPGQIDEVIAIPYTLDDESFTSGFEYLHAEEVIEVVQFRDEMVPLLPDERRNISIVADLTNNTNIDVIVNFSAASLLFAELSKIYEKSFAMRFISAQLLISTEEDGAEFPAIKSKLGIIRLTSRPLQRGQLPARVLAHVMSHPDLQISRADIVLLEDEHLGSFSEYVRQWGVSRSLKNWFFPISEQGQIYMQGNSHIPVQDWRELYRAHLPQ